MEEVLKELLEVGRWFLLIGGAIVVLSILVLMVCVWRLPPRKEKITLKVTLAPGVSGLTLAEIWLSCGLTVHRPGLESQVELSPPNQDFFTITAPNHNIIRNILSDNDYLRWVQLEEVEEVIES